MEVSKPFVCGRAPEALRQERGRLREGYHHHPAAGVDFSALVNGLFSMSFHAVSSLKRVESYIPYGSWTLEP